MQLVVWNSQGAKWDTFWTHFYAPLLGQGEDVIGLVVESGWAPWVLSGDVQVDSIYGFNWNQAWYNRGAENTSAFVHGVAQDRNRTAFWVPWRKSLDSEWSNSRCSMGCVMTTTQRSVHTNRYVSPNQDVYPRSVFHFLLSIRTGRALQADFSVFLVHLKSGSPLRAQEQVNDLTARVPQILPQGTGAIVVGDFNINLQTTALYFPRHWYALRTNMPTQQSGGELDYALIYDPNGHYHNTSTVTYVQQYKTGNNQSDHAVPQYNITL